MATKNKMHYYVLVLTDNGPKFVTKVNYLDKTAEWNGIDAPLEMTKTDAQELARGLCLNWNFAFAVMQDWSIDTQVYRYNLGGFEWSNKPNNASIYDFARACFRSEEFNNGGIIENEKEWLDGVGFEYETDNGAIKNAGIDGSRFYDAVITLQELNKKYSK